MEYNTKITSAGILRTVQSTTQERGKNMKSALQDMEALMLKAKDMVTLAAELNEKLTAVTSARTNSNPSSPSPSAEEPEDATFVRSSLSQLGLQITNAPVTIDMMKDERKWLEELAKELGRVLQGSYRPGIASGGLMRDRGIIALDEVWGGWNRSRGVGMSSVDTTNLRTETLNHSSNPTIHLSASNTSHTNVHGPSNPTSCLCIWFKCPAHTSVHTCILCNTTLEVPTRERSKDHVGNRRF